MRITGGQARGRGLQSPRGTKVRPTSDKVRVALFHILGDIEGVRVLDLCCGAGTLSLEALSRGVAEVVLVDQDGGSLQLARHNVQRAGFGEVRALKLDAAKAAHLLQAEAHPFHLIFLDPPYHSDVYTRVMEVIGQGGLLREGGLLVVEHDQDRSMPPTWGVLRRDEIRQWGRTCITFYTCDDGSAAVSGDTPATGLGPSGVDTGSGDG